MKQLLEIVPIILFFVVYQMDGKEISVAGWDYQFDGIFTATAVLMIGTLLQFIIVTAMERRIEKRSLWLLAAIMVFGGATLLFRNQAFIQWKPSVFNWALAAVFAASQFIGERNLMERTLGTQIHLPKKTWSTLNWTWVIYFLIVGGLNLYVVFNFSESTWVDYKLYSAIGFTLALGIVTTLIIAPQLKEGGDGGFIEEDPS